MTYDCFCAPGSHIISTDLCVHMLFCSCNTLSPALCTTQSISERLTLDVSLCVCVFNVVCHLLALREQCAACLWGGDAGERGSGIGPPPTKNKRLSDGGPADPSLAKWELC